METAKDGIPAVVSPQEKSSVENPFAVLEQAINKAISQNPLGFTFQEMLQGRANDWKRGRIVHPDQPQISTIVDVRMKPDSNTPTDATIKSTNIKTGQPMHPQNKVNYDVDTGGIININEGSESRTRYGLRTVLTAGLSHSAFSIDAHYEDMIPALNAASKETAKNITIRKVKPIGIPLIRKDSDHIGIHVTYNTDGDTTPNFLRVDQTDIPLLSAEDLKNPKKVKDYGPSLAVDISDALKVRIHITLVKTGEETYDYNIVMEAMSPLALGEVVFPSNIAYGFTGELRIPAFLTGEMKKKMIERGYLNVPELIKPKPTPEQSRSGSTATAGGAGVRKPDEAGAPSGGGGAGVGKRNRGR